MDLPILIVIARQLIGHGLVLGLVQGNARAWLNRKVLGPGLLMFCCATDTANSDRPTAVIQGLELRTLSFSKEDHI